MKEYKNEKGQFHNTDGPAVVRSNGDKYWYLNGQLHRTDGPAVEFVNGDKAWFLNNELHHTDGPAVEYAYGKKYWYLYGKQLTEEQFNDPLFRSLYFGV